MDNVWQFQLLGNLRAQRGEQVITRFATTRSAALLARMALFPQRAHPREELVDLLWPDSEIDSGRLNLRVALASLRRQLEPPDVPQGSVLIADRSLLRLQHLACRCDAVEFEETLKVAARSQDLHKKREALDRALTLYAGELLPGFYDEWILEERERLAALYQDACEQQQRLPKVVTLDASEKENGVQALPDMRGFPVQFTRFFGRTNECETLESWLRSPETRLVTLTGPGGSGKTRLAFEAARRVQGVFAGPSCFVPLADLGNACLIPDAIAQALSLTRSATEESLEQVVAHLAALPPALLVLDNFEHLVDRGAPLLFSLLSRLPTLTCLVTSRRRLALPGERECPVPPLGLPEADGTPDQVAQTASAQLFADRAQAARPDFQITPGNAAAVAALCRTLEGIPLALELAAARAQTLTPAQMNKRLTQRFEVLTSRRGDKGGRHRSLWAALAWSYDLLNRDLQRFFLRLSVFRGGGTVEGAQVVCEEPQALEYLTQLRERSLIVLEESAGEMRFRLLETLREFGKEQMDEEARTALAAQHAAWYGGLAREAWPQITGPDQARWLNRLEADHDNLRLALSFWLSQDEAVDEATEEALEMGGSLWRFWSTRGHYTTGREWLRQALARPGGRPYTRARAANGAGNLARIQGDYPAAEAFYTEALAIMRELGLKTSIGACLCNLGMVAMHREDYAKAQALQKEALILRQESGDRGGIAFTFQCQGMVAHHLKDYALARCLYGKSLALWNALDDDSGRLWSLSNLAAIAGDEGDPDTSGRLLGEALEICLKLQDLHGLHGLLSNIASLTARRGNASKAVQIYAAAEALRRRIGAGLSPKDAADLEAQMAEARRALSAAEYASAWSTGDAMTAEQTVAAARE
jgi:predicted ATPase